MDGEFAGAHFRVRLPLGALSRARGRRCGERSQASRPAVSDGAERRDERFTRCDSVSPRPLRLLSPALDLAAAPGRTSAAAALAAAESPRRRGRPARVATPKPVEIGSYLDMLRSPRARRCRPPDARNWRRCRPSRSRTRPPRTGCKYALALGAAGRPASNPVEAKRLIAELLAEQHDLQPQEVSLANAYLREFDARVALYADLARQREESERRLQRRRCRRRPARRRA